MTKFALLEYLMRVGEADANEVAAALRVQYPVAAMSLLRLVRQGLASRYVDPDHRTFWYRLTEQGRARLRYLRESDE